MDFTINKYQKLLHTLIDAGYAFQTFSSYLQHPEERSVILRHDVDKKPVNSLLFSKIQKDLEICGTYYFRVVPKSYDKDIILEISEAGHEIGYHYEDLNLTAQSLGRKFLKKMDLETLVSHAFDRFRSNLEGLRSIVPVHTICMHGSPFSRWDGRILWKYHDYKSLKIIGEPYFDIDFSTVLYLTDTGRKWNGNKYSIRDKLIPENLSAVDHYAEKENVWATNIVANHAMNLSPDAQGFQNQYQFSNTNHLIKAIQEKEFPEKAMLTFHPQRWTDDLMSWNIELISQKLKNIIKRFLILTDLR